MTATDRHQVQAVLFDLDDTLLDTASAFAAAVAAMAAEFLPHLEADRYPEVLATWRVDSGGHYQAHVDGVVDYRTQRFARAQQIQEQFGGAVLDDAGYDRWAQVWDRAFSGAWAAFEDTAVILAALRSAGLAVGCVTNAGTEQQSAKLAAVGLTDAVPLLVTLDTFGVGKPDPRVFHEGVRLLGFEPHQVMYVGDEPVIDARAATAAGLHGVWLDRPGRRRDHAGEDADALRAEGIAVIEGLAELTDLIPALTTTANVPPRG
ncbi:MAG TPA: HAD family hydrolase [Candidatus Ruania gallistercoris]|uniref:HAD family hydrolase n=1 Tax=Candidatus Ruania gallistercoris TaxID=2838746 RepID=A0A9D2EBW1_9MICO|nr:HAD family hydrolase [Candidatus Ruania gallistercoris]